VERVIEQREPVRFSPYRIPVRPLIVGLVATAGMLTFYLGLVSLISWSWDHALSLLVEDRWFVTLLVVGFGVQAGLFTYLRALHGAGKAPAAVTGSSVGVSTAAMVACCAHHLTDVLPLLGLSAATVFLAEYKVPFLGWYPTRQESACCRSESARRGAAIRQPRVLQTPPITLLPPRRRRPGRRAAVRALYPVAFGRPGIFWPGS
jgi:hypothetical protein